MSLSQSVTTATQSTTTPTTSASTAVAPQPYGNQAALEDAGLTADYSQRYLDEQDDDIAYMALVGWGIIDFSGVLATCLADPKRAPAQRWLSHYTLEDVAREAPEMVDSVRDLLWPMDRRIAVGGEASVMLEAGGELRGEVATERTDHGFSVELEGELRAGLDVELPAELEALNASLAAIEPDTQQGTDVNVGIGVDVGAGVSAGWQVKAGWELDTDAMDGMLAGAPCSPSLDALVRSIDMLIESLTAPDTWAVDQVVGAQAEAGGSVGIGAEAGAEVGVAFGYGLDGDHYYSHATISGGVTAGFDWGLMQELLDDPRLVDAAAEFGGEVGVRLEIPRDTVTDPRTARFFLCWSTKAGEASSSTWLEAGALPSAAELLLELLTGGDRGGVLAAADVPDRAMVRSIERPIEDEAQRAALAELVDRPGDEYGAQVRTTMVAKGSLRVETGAIWSAMGNGATTFDTCGESGEDAVLDAERQIAAHFFGETYEWAGGGQLSMGLDRAVAGSEVAESRVEVATEIDSSLMLSGEVGHERQELDAGAASSITYTSVLPVPASELHLYVAA